MKNLNFLGPSAPRSQAPIWFACCSRSIVPRCAARWPETGCATAWTEKWGPSRQASDILAEIPVFYQIILQFVQYTHIERVLFWELVSRCNNYCIFSNKPCREYVSCYLLSKRMVKMLRGGNVLFCWSKFYNVQYMSL